MLANEKVGGKNSKRYVDKELSNNLNNGYNKNDIQFERFLPHVDFAIEQEKQFKQDVDEIFNQVGCNIGVVISKMKRS